MPEKITTPTKLAIARKSANLTQKQLATKSGVSLGTIREYERGRNNINNARVIIVADLADAIGVSVREIMNDPQPSEVPSFGQKNISGMAASCAAAGRGSPEAGHKREVI